MKPLFLRYPSIRNFRDIVQEIKTKTSLQEVEFVQTVKLHGTNASVVLDCENNLYSQSRNRILSIDNDNQNFASFVENNKQIFREELNNILSTTEATHVVVYGEWCGEGIASKVAITKLPKMFVIFAIRLVFNSSLESENSKWLDITLPLGINLKPFRFSDKRIYNITDFPSQTINIDFEEVSTSLAELNNFTTLVDQECPVAKQLGVIGNGEGNVYHTKDFKYVFKMKGDSHSKAKQKIKNLTGKDLEDLEQISKLANILVSPERLQQGLDYMKEMNIETLSSNTGIFIKWVVQDILKEELDLIKKTSLNQKNVISSCVKLAKDFYMENTIC